MARGETVVNRNRAIAATVATLALASAAIFLRDREPARIEAPPAVTAPAQPEPLPPYRPEPEDSLPPLADPRPPREEYAASRKASIRRPAETRVVSLSSFTTAPALAQKCGARVSVKGPMIGWTAIVARIGGVDFEAPIPNPSAAVIAVSWSDVPCGTKAADVQLGRRRTRSETFSVARR